MRGSYRRSPTAGKLRALRPQARNLRAQAPGSGRDGRAPGAAPAGLSGGREARGPRQVKRKDKESVEGAGLEESSRQDA